MISERENVNGKDTGMTSVMPNWHLNRVQLSKLIGTFLLLTSKLLLLAEVKNNITNKICWIFQSLILQTWHKMSFECFFRFFQCFVIR